MQNFSAIFFIHEGVDTRQYLWIIKAYASFPRLQHSKVVRMLISKTATWIWKNIWLLYRVWKKELCMCFLIFEAHCFKGLHCMYRIQVVFIQQSFEIMTALNEGLYELDQSYGCCIAPRVTWSHFGCLAIYLPLRLTTGTLPALAYPSPIPHHWILWAYLSSGWVPIVLGPRFAGSHILRPPLPYHASP